MGRLVVRRTWRRPSEKGWRLETVEGGRRVGRRGGKVIYLVIIKLPALATRIVVNIQMRLHLWSHKLYVSPPLASCPALCSRISSSFLSSSPLPRFNATRKLWLWLVCTPGRSALSNLYHVFSPLSRVSRIFPEVRRTYLTSTGRKKLGWNWSPLLSRKIGRDFSPVLSPVFPRYVRKWTLIFTSLFDSCFLTWKTLVVPKNFPSDVNIISFNLWYIFPPYIHVYAHELYPSPSP